MSVHARQAAKALQATMFQNVAKTPAVPVRMPDWLEAAERQSAIKAEEQTRDQDTSGAAPPVAASSSNSTVEGTYYEVYVGAKLKLYSTKQQETHLRNMHEVNHRELPIARLAARVADFLWPNCQEIVDDAIAKSKGVRKQIAMLEEAEFIPPHVPEFLPITSWIRNNASLRESFVCDKTTRYKPRMSWYNPNDGMIPSGWWKDGLLADLAYYKPFTGTRQPHQKI